jgi:hypothetical protein
MSALLKPPEAAAALSMTVDALLQHVRAGDLTYIAIGRGTKKIRRRFLQSDLDEFLERRKRRDRPNGPDKPPSPSKVFDIKEARSLRKAGKIGSNTPRKR